jgi:predicted 3-demethylubiquinone-9 3-methyltransferase (glyoxalase superfamily)
MCDDQEEVDYYWEKLGEGGDPNARQCGWLKDRFGLSWQVVPTVVTELLSDPSSERSQRAMEAVMEMKKIDIDTVRRAYDGG